MRRIRAGFRLRSFHPAANNARVRRQGS